MIRSFNRLPVWSRQVAVGNYFIQVPNFDRWLYVKLLSLQLMGREEREILSRHISAGMTIIDIGANIGLYSIFLADLVGPGGRVFAFEPDPVLFEAAVANCTQNGKGDVITLHNLALGSRAGHAALYRSGFNSGDNRLSASPKHRENVGVEIARLDDVLRGVKIDFVKMDVQGWEPEVLRGMEETLKSNPELTIYFEYWPEGLRRAGEHLSSPANILCGRGFKLFLPADEKAPLSSKQIEDLGKKYSGNRFVNLLARR